MRDPSRVLDSDRWSPTVWMYHSISPSTQPDPYRIRVRPERLDAQLGTLRRLGIHGLSLSELVRAHERGTAHRLVGLTFDDGYADFAEHAVPALARHGMTATVYVVAGRLGGENDWDDGPRLDLLSAQQVRDVCRAGHEVGSHTLTHRRMVGLAPATLKAEVVESKALLEDVIGEPVRGFSYPYGECDAAAVDAVRAAGYDYACATDDYPAGGRFTMNRFYVGQQDSAPRLIAKFGRHQLRRMRAAHRRP